MRLFLYYATHSLLNTIRKVMKTWVALILVFIVFGAMVGLVANLFDKDDKSGKDGTDTVISTVVDGEEGPGEEISLEDAADGTFAKSKIGQMMKQYNITKEQIVDLVISSGACHQYPECAEFEQDLPACGCTDAFLITDETPVCTHVQTPLHTRNIAYRIALHAVPAP